MRFREQRRNDVAPGIEIGGDEHELAETRLPEVLRQHLRVASSEDGDRWPRQRRRAANQIPDGRREPLAGRFRRQRRTEHAPPPPASRTAVTRGSAGQPTADGEHGEHDEERNRGRARNSRGQIRSGERRLQPCRIPRDDRCARLNLQHLQHEADEIHEQARKQDRERREQRREQHNANAAAARIGQRQP